MQNVALVTGAGSGIGQATAELLAARGLHVIAVGRTLATLEATCSTIVQQGGSAECVAADVGNAADLACVVAAVADRPVSVIVHCAARHELKSFLETTREDFEAQVAVNLIGPFFLTQALAPRLTDGAGIV